ncbi:MAG: 30S ribosomal protein S12 methylthiotransferase RimO, partial [Clostridia bacterium]|nr:30S ribosomal protein S12 methylthiotransferase RimO [Clostridia bacterium]
MKIGFVSLGCSKNLVDTEVMLKKLVDAGYEITPDDTEADIIIVNTCGFIQSAKEEAIENILDVAWLKKHKNLRGIIATGCLVERYRQEVLREMPEVDAALGTGSYHKIVEAVEAVARGE